MYFRPVTIIPKNAAFVNDFPPRPTEINFQITEKWYTVGVDRTTLIDFFEEVGTTEEYNGYFCSIAEAVGIVVLGSVWVQEREPDPSLGGKCACEGIFEGEIPNCAYSVLLLAVDALENGKA